VSRPAVYALYALLVAIWSSTWVAIKIGLEDTPALLGAGIRFAFAGLVLLAIAAIQRRPLGTDWRLAAILGLAPFAFTYGLVYWGEQYIPSGLTAVLFGVMPLYTALLAAALLSDEPLRLRVLVGVAIAIGGLTLAFAESLDLGHEERALLGSLAVLASPVGAAIGNVSLRLRGQALDAVVLNGWGMALGGVLLLAVSAAGEDWGELAWTAESIGSISYLAIVGSAIPFVGLTVLLRHIKAQSTSYIAMLIPFGALAFGALLEGETVTLRAIGGAALVAIGLAIAQRRAESPRKAVASGR
jgi:drug/metabolite transporter (DMT)-like permease